MLIVATVIIVACLCNWISGESASSINNILIGLATNLIGIIVTVSFVQYYIDKQNIAKEKQEEREKILRYNRIAKILISRYTLFFQCVTSTIENRSKFATSTDLSRDFSFADMADLYMLSTYLFDELLKPSIELFYDAELKLREYIVTMLQDIDFKHYTEIEKILTSFAECSMENDVRGVIINNQRINHGDIPAAEEVSKLIQDDIQYNWVEKFTQGKLNGNMMTPYVVLYLLLKKEGQYITKYQQQINRLFKQTLRR